MTGRSVPLWIGATPDTAAPLRVRLRVFERERGLCHRCRRKISASDKWTLEHVVALANGGRNAEENLACTCEWCLPIKNAQDVAIKAKGARIRARHTGAAARRPTLQSRGFSPAPKQNTASSPIRKWRAWAPDNEVSE